MYWIWIFFTNLNEYLLDRGLGLVAKGTDCISPDSILEHIRFSITYIYIYFGLGFKQSWTYGDHTLHFPCTSTLLYTEIMQEELPQPYYVSGSQSHFKQGSICFILMQTIPHRHIEWFACPWLCLLKASTGQRCQPILLRLLPCH